MDSDIPYKVGTPAEIEERFVPYGENLERGFVWEPSQGLRCEEIFKVKKGLGPVIRLNPLEAPW